MPSTPLNAIVRKADILLEALPYLQAFRGKTFVIKYGGSALADAIITDRTKVPAATRKKLDLLIGKYFSSGAMSS